jgi:uncharacterized protein
MSNGSAVVAATPLFRIAGEDRPELGAQLLALNIQEDALGLYRCEATFGNWGSVEGRIGFRYFDREVLDFGKSFAVASGDRTLFEGRIMGLRAVFPDGGPSQITVLADDRLQDLRMTRRTRSFADSSDADVMRTIASDHSLTPEIDVSGPTHRLLAQVNQSDLAFLRERARAVDAEAWVSGSTLHVKRRSARGGSPIEMALGNQLRRFDVTADLAGQRTSVTVSGWDVAAKRAIRAEATASAISSELGGGRSGAAILEEIGTRKENLAHPIPITNTEGQAIAESFFRIGARRFVCGRGVADVGAGLRVGALVELTGLGPMFSGRYSVVAVRHRFDQGAGIRTEFEAERPGISE